MKPLTDAIIDAVHDEKFRASEIYGAIFHSDHEGKSVIEEQRDTARREGGEFDYWFANLWTLIKQDKDDDIQIVKDKRRCLKQMLSRAENATHQWIQVAAMCKKAIETLNNRTDYEEQE